MARARNIKPGIMENEELAELDPFARLLFIYLWMLADCEGRLEDRPKRIKAQALPYDDVDCDELLTELALKRFIIRYKVDGDKYIQITKFTKHQYVTSDEKKKGSSIPDYNQAQSCSDVVTTNIDNDLSILSKDFESTSKGLRSELLNTELLNTDKLNTEINTFAPNDSKPNRSAQKIDPPKPSKPKIDFSFESGQFENISEEHERRWGEAYPAVDIGLNIKQAAAWLIANPKKRKQDYQRFLTHWFARCQEKGGNIPVSRASPKSNYDKAMEQAQFAAEIVRDAEVAI